MFVWPVRHSKWWFLYLKKPILRLCGRYSGEKEPGAMISYAHSAKGALQEVWFMSILSECPGCRQKQSNKNKFCPKCGTDLDKAKRSGRVRYWIDYRLPGGKQRRSWSVMSIRGSQGGNGKASDPRKGKGAFLICFQNPKWPLTILPNGIYPLRKSNH